MTFGREKEERSFGPIRGLNLSCITGYEHMEGLTSHDKHHKHVPPKYVHLASVVAGMGRPSSMA